MGKYDKDFGVNPKNGQWEYLGKSTKSKPVAKALDKKKVQVEVKRPIHYTIEDHKGNVLKKG